MISMPQLRSVLLALAAFLIPAASAAQAAPAAPTAPAAPVTPAAPAPESAWQASANLTYADTSGNTDTESTGGGLGLTLTSGPWSTSAQLQAVRAENQGTLIAESYTGSLIGQRHLTGALSAALIVWATRNRFQGLDLHLITGTGLVWSFLDRPDAGFSFTAGAGWERQDFIAGLPQEDESQPAAALQLAHRRQLMPGVSTSLVAYWFAGLDDPSDSTFNSTIALQAAISHAFSIQLSYQWSYVNEPPGPTIKSTDSAFNAGLVLTLPAGTPSQ